MKTSHRPLFSGLLRCLGAAVLLAVPCLAVAQPTINVPLNGSEIDTSPRVVHISTNGITDVLWVKIRSNGNLLGYAKPGSFFGEWSFPDEVHLSVMSTGGDDPVLMDYSFPWDDESAMFMLGGDFVAEGEFNGIFDSWLPPAYEYASGSGDVSLRFNSYGLLEATLSGEDPLGTRELSGGRDSSTELFDYVWTPSTGTHSLTAELAYLDGLVTKTSTSAAIRVTVRGAGSPDIAVAQPSGSNIANGGARSFGSVELKKTSDKKRFVIQNTGSVLLGSLRLTKTGTHASDFLVTALSKTALGPGTSVGFDVTFKPSAAGPRSATLRIASNDPNENPYLIKLSGNGTAMPEIQVFQPSGSKLSSGKASRNLGKIQVGKTGKAMVFTIKNTGSGKLTSIKVGRSGGNKNDFLVSAPKKSTLNPGASTSFSVQFKPTAKGSRSTSIQIASNDKKNHPFKISVVGMGVR